MKNNSGLNEIYKIKQEINDQYEMLDTIKKEKEFDKLAWDSVLSTIKYLKDKKTKIKNKLNLEQGKSCTIGNFPIKQKHIKNPKKQNTNLYIQENSKN